MKIFNSVDQFLSKKNTIVTIGTFDGVHLGHKVILERLINQANIYSLESVLLTFSPHPRNVLSSNSNNLRLLTTDEEKIQRLNETDLDNLIIQKFTKEFSKIRPVNFIQDILIKKLNMKRMIVGYDHQFGRNREGSYEELKKLSKLHSFSIDKVQQQSKDNVSVSSTKIRKMLSNGKIRKSNLLLDYSYILIGVVCHGKKIGRTIGYPTANINFEKNKLLPQCGVYLVRLTLDSTIYYGMSHIDCIKNNLEVHLFSFSEDIYNRKVKVEFLEFIRENKKFNNIEDLKLQLQKDEIISKSILKLTYNY